MLGDQPRRGLRDAQARSVRRAQALRDVPDVRAAGRLNRAVPFESGLLEQLVAHVLRGAPRQAGASVSSRPRGRKLREEALAHVARFVAQARVGVDAHARSRLPAACQRLLRDAFQRPLHEADPDRQRRDAAGLVGAERLRLVEADPRHADHRRVEAAEPRVDVLVGRAGLAGEVLAPERPARAWPVPKLITSRSSVVITNALRGSIARSAPSPATTGLASDSTLPLASVTRAIRYGATR